MKIKTTYMAVARDCNSWSQSTGLGSVTWDCGHKHRSVEAAVTCLSNMGEACCSYQARIESSDFEVSENPCDPSMGMLFDVNGFDLLS